MPSPVSSKTLVPIRANGMGSPLVLCHAIGGTVMFYHELASCLSQGRPVYALQAMGLNPGEAPCATIGEMAQGYIKALSSAIDIESIHLGGYSFGCLVSIEMARQLEKSGHSLQTLALISPPSDISQRERAYTLANRSLIRNKAEELLSGFLSRGTIAVAPELQQVLLALYEANILARYSYECPTIRSNIALFLPEGEPRLGMRDIEDAWAVRTTGGLTSIYVPGNHTEMIHKPLVNELAAAIERLIAKSDHRKLDQGA